MTDEAAEPEPVFIIGAARSGTKFLRDTLAAAPGIAAVPYDINYIWRRGNESVAHDELDPVSCDARQAAGIRRDVIRQALRGYRGTVEVVLEKTVSNTLRVPFLERVTPAAKYIYLLRDGRDTVESCYRCWQQPPDYRYLLKKAQTFPFTDWRYALGFIKRLLERGNGKRAQQIWGPVYRGMLEDVETKPLDVVVARQWKRCVEASLNALETLPRERVMTLRFEEITASTDWIQRAMGFLGQNEATGAVIDQYHKTVRQPLPDRWMITFSGSQRMRIWQEIEDTVVNLGYR